MLMLSSNRRALVFLEPLLGACGTGPSGLAEAPVPSFRRHRRWRSRAAGAVHGINSGSLTSSGTPTPVVICSSEWALQCGTRHSGSPALRRPSASVARSCGRRSTYRSLTSEIRNVGSSWRRRAIAACALSSRPMSALLAANTRRGGVWPACSCSDRSAHDAASS